MVEICFSKLNWLVSIPKSVAEYTDEMFELFIFKSCLFSFSSHLIIIAWKLPWFTIKRVRLNCATTYHDPPPSTTTYHQPKYIYHHPPPPTNSQNISTTTHHYPLNGAPPSKNQNIFIYNLLLTLFNSFFFYEMQYSFPWRRFCVMKFWSVSFSNSKFVLHFMIFKIF